MNCGIFIPGTLAIEINEVQLQATIWVNFTTFKITEDRCEN